ncbi:TetR family transcriptional regulator [Nocardia sp. SYP-A9097]|uniref:TetR/AcrR family transcriptional regulator n=1 Tax=Nocardia sp. SYP-A9097 TaxID=2663237 RepID=UPI00129ADC17|nr:TetR/AcrR family transcriptional regulator [Nocardia sp. SYP-A9097]MRH90796.1 TetR family transcriptional regulator [Nocardia sp. SYP-A9097]
MGDRTADVLDATLRCLLRYGARRTTMDDIASETGVSRSAVYQYVRNKDDAVRRLAEGLHVTAMTAAREAAAEPIPVADKVFGIASAKVQLAAGPFAESPHAAELIDEQARLCGDICRGFTDDLHGLLTGVLDEAGLDRPADTARIVLATTIGLLSAGRTDLLRTATDALLDGFGTTVKTLEGEQQ